MVFDPLAQKWVKGDHDLAEQSGSTEDDVFRDFDTTRGSEPTVDDGNQVELVEQEQEQAQEVDSPEVALRSSLAKLQREDDLAGLGITAGTPEEDKSREGENHFLPLEPTPAAELEVEEEAGDESEQVWGGQGPKESTATMEFFREESPFDLFQAMSGTGGGDERPSATPDDERTATQQLAHEEAVLPLDIAEPLRITQVDARSPSAGPTPIRAPLPTTPRPPLSAQPPRSALKSYPTRAQSAPGVLCTPMSAMSSDSRPPRSVSFEDGKRNGKIEGKTKTSDQKPLRSAPRAGSGLKFEMCQSVDGGPFGELEMDEVEALFSDSPTDGKGSLRTLGIENALRELQSIGTFSSFD